MPSSRPASPKSPPEDEIIFLTLHHLHTYDSNPAVAKALQTLENALTDLRKLPTVNDYTGAEHSLTYAQCADRFRHIPPAYLRDLLRSRLGPDPNSSSTLLNDSCLPPAMRKRIRTSRLNYTRARMLPHENVNVVSIIQQYSYLHMPFPIRRLTHGLLPTAFRRIKRVVGHHLPVFTTVYDHLSRLIITGSDDHLIKIWSAETAYLQHTLRGHDSNITEIVRHPTRPIIVSASCDSTLRVWDLSTGAAMHVLNGGAREVNAVQFSPCPDRPYLVSGGADGSIRLWNANDFDAGSIRICVPQRSVARHATDTQRAAATSPAPEPDNFVDTTTSPRLNQSLPQVSLDATVSASPSIQTCSILTSPPLTVSHPPNSNTASIPVSHPHPTIVTQSLPPQTSPIGPTASHPSTQTQQPSAQPNSGSQYEPTSRSQAQASSVVSGTPLNEVLSVSFDTGATRLAVGGTDCSAHLFAIDLPKTTSKGMGNAACSIFPSVRHLKTLRGHSDGIIQVLFSHSGDRIVTASRDGTARIWRRTKAQLPIGKKTKADVSGMGTWNSTVLDCRRSQADARSTFSGAASGSACGSIVPRTRRNIVPVSLCAVMWSHNDHFVLTSSSDAKIRMWDSETGQLIRILEGHTQEVYTIHFHPLNDNILLTGGYDGKCIFWDLESGKQLRAFFLGDESNTNSNDALYSEETAFKTPSICDGQFAHDGLSFVVSDNSGAITVFGVDSGERTALAPEEQFFANEHIPFRRDAEQRVVHESTGRLMHLEPKGLLCDRHFHPHSAELQPDIADFFDYEIKDIQSSNSSRLSPDGRQSQHLSRALLAKAKEFRDIQERKENRLIREAKLARRRLNLARQNALLQRDTIPQYLSLKDFEVADTDFEDSDKDFNAEDVVMNESSSSSSSDEEDKDEICPVRRGSDKAEGIVYRGSDRDLLAGAVKKRGPPRKARERARRSQASLHESGDDDEARGDLDEESPAYEMESHESGSDDSGSSKDLVQRKLKSRIERSRKNMPAERRISSSFAPLATGLTSKSPRKPQALSLHVPVSPTHSQTPFTPSLTLAGASILMGRKRMKISMSIDARNNRTQSTSSNPTGNQHSTLNDGLVHGNAVRESNDMRATIAAFTQSGPSETGACTGPSASQNPSNTTERKEGNDLTRGLTHIEEHQDDAASCFGSRSLTAILREDRAVSASLDGIRQQSSTRNSPDPEHSGGPNQSQQIASKPRLNFGEDDEHDEVKSREKTVLSGSPGRVTRTGWRARTRSSAVKDGLIESATVPSIDIDDIAEKEVEILDAQRTKKRKRGRARASPTQSDGEHTSDDGGDCGIEQGGLDSGKRLRRRRNSKGSGTGSGKDRSTEDGGGERRTLEASEWLRVSNNRYSYVPQVEDEVMYFAEGHIAAINIARDAGLEPLLDKVSYKRLGKEVIDGIALGKDCPPLRFQTVGVSYQFPTVSQKIRVASAKGKTTRANAESILAHSKTVIILTLRLLSGLKRKPGQTEEFVLSYFPVDAPDYLVLSNRVEAALSRGWKPMDRFRILFLNERRAWQYYTGTIRNVKPTLHKAMWNSIEVEYDNEGDFDKANTDLVSPWELEPDDLLQSSKDLTAASAYSALGNKINIEPGLFPIIAKELDAIRSTEMSMRAKLSWMDTVDALAIIPGYCDVVPCPMDLNIILVRLCTGYYRHYNSFMHDVLLVKTNAIRFHGLQSEIGTLTSTVCHSISDTARRTREQFLLTAASVNQNLHNGIHTSGAQTSSRGIWARPMQSDLLPGNFGGPSHGSGVVNSAKPFGIAMTPRTASSQGFANGAIMGNTLDGTGVGQHRTWNGMRVHAGHQCGNNQAVMMYGNQQAVGSLPPTLPTVTNGSTTKGLHGGRGGSRTKGVGHQNNGTIKQAGGRAAVVGSTAQAQGSPTMSVSAAAGAFPTLGGDVVRNLSQSDHGQGGLTQHSRTAAMASSSHNVAPISTRGELGKGSVVDPSYRHGIPISTVGCAVSQLPFSEMITSNGGPLYVGNGVVSPPPDGVAIAGTVSATQLGVQGAVSRSRGMMSNGGGDGGAHSWSRSMEAAGGMFPLQASTSDSHLAVRHSPISPVGRVEGGNGALRNPNTAYHEHSTVSMAAAESTMSCGGAEVALQAASAESIDVATSSRTVSDGRKVR